MRINKAALADLGYNIHEPDSDTLIIEGSRPIIDNQHYRSFAKDLRDTTDLDLAEIEGELDRFLGTLADKVLLNDIRKTS